MDKNHVHEPENTVKRMLAPDFDSAVDELFDRFNEPVIRRETIARWLGRFEGVDREAALLLLRNIEYHTQPRLKRETKRLHEKLVEGLARDNFDTTGFHDVDFSREFTCRSGDVVCYIYRKSNLVPSVDFKTFDYLVRATAEAPEKFGDRALVILDDYIGTGSQFMFEFIGRSDDDVRVLNSYKKVYLTCYVINERALRNFRLAADGKIEEIIRTEEDQFPDTDFSQDEELFRRTLSQLDWKNIEPVYLEEEQSLLSPKNTTLSDEEKQKVQRLLKKYSHDGYTGTSYLIGHHAFFFGAPNALPELLWPLFNRVEDFSIYPDRPQGITEEIVDYGVDDEV